MACWSLSQVVFVIKYIFSVCWIYCQQTTSFVILYDKYNQHCQTTIIFSLQRQLKIPIEKAKKNHIFRPPFQLKFSEFSSS